MKSTSALTRQADSCASSQRTCAPWLYPSRPLDLPAQVVRVQADDADVAVPEAVHRRAGGRAVAGKIQPLADPAVADGLVVADRHVVGGHVGGEQLRLMVAGGEHPRNGGRARLDHREPARPDPRVVVVPAAAVGRRLRRVAGRRLLPVGTVGVDDRLDIALGLGVAEVPGEQAKPRRSAVGQVPDPGDLPDHGRGRVDPGDSRPVGVGGIVGAVIPHAPVRLGQQRRVAVQGWPGDALVGEGGEREWLGLVARRRDEGGVGRDADLAAGGVAEAVVVFGAGVQAGHARVHEELIGVERPGRPQHARLAHPIPGRG